MKALSRYFEVMLNRRHSKHRVASTIKANESHYMDSLWAEHKILQEKFHKVYDELSLKADKKPAFSYHDLKIKIAEKIFEVCKLCERRCLINRALERGYCGVEDARIASEFIHLGEETPLVPSHTIFFAGCTFQCVYCQNWDISQGPESGMKLSEKKLASIIDRRRDDGSRNVNFVGGDPTPNLLYILKTMKFVKKNIPVIWNSNLYMSLEAMQLLDGFIDLYLTDFKYGPGECGLRLSKVDNYWDIITRNHKLASQAGDMIIRHLVLPNHVECCSKPILKWIYQNLGKKTTINIMSQYRPVYNAFEYLDISRFPSKQEIREVVDYAKSLGFKNLI